MKIISKEMKEQLSYSLPTAIECTLVTLIGIIDTAAIKPLGSSAIAAVGAMVVVINLVYLLLQSVNVSNNAMIARLKGQNDYERIKKNTGTSVYLSVFLTIISVIITIGISKFLPNIFKVDKICLTYLYIRFIGAIPVAISSVLSGHQRTIGNSKKIMKIVVLSVILNTVFDYIAIKLNYGIAGVALATVLVDVITMVITMYISRKTVKYVIDKKILKKLTPLVKYAAYERVVSRCGNLIFNIILSRIGTIEYAAHVVLMQIMDAFDNFIYGMGVGVTSVLGINLGRHNKEKLEIAKENVNILIKNMMIYFPLVFMCISIIILPLLLKEKAALIIAYNLVIFGMLYVCLNSNNTTTMAILRANKDFKYQAKIKLISLFFVRITLSYILCNTPLGIYGAWITFVIEAIVLYALLKKRRYELDIQNIKEINNFKEVEVSA